VKVWIWFALALVAYSAGVGMSMLMAPLAWIWPGGPLPPAAYIASMLLAFLVAPLLVVGGLIALWRKTRRQAR
jgi:hypothetical protein